MINQSILEGEEFLERPEGVDVSLLDKAIDYHIDLEKLEEIYTEENLPSEEKNNKTVKDLRFLKTLGEMDVNLEEMARYFFGTSERVVFIVSDDKIVYLNKKAQTVLELNDFQQGLDEPFLTFVDRSDWNKLTENIGKMLTSHETMPFNLRTFNKKLIPLEFGAVYLPNSTHFNFILISSHEEKKGQASIGGLYDDLTGLPNFHLFEDRLQTAVNNEMYKDSRLAKTSIGVMGISLENIEYFRKLQIEDFVLKKIAYNLVLSLRKNCTVARGVKYPFWILVPDLENEEELIKIYAKIYEVLSVGVSDNFTTHEVVFCAGGSVFPQRSRSAKKLVEQTIDALKKAQERKAKNLVLFDGK